MEGTVNVWAVDSETEEDMYGYDILDNGTVTITRYYGNDKDIVIPSKLENKPVTAIGNNAFWWESSLSSVTIPDSVISIGNNVFEDCENLTSITIPDSVISIGNDVFKDCKKLTSITIPDSVTSMGSFSFTGCNNLVSINLPKCVTSIGDEAFYGCSSLTSINIPDSVTSIGDNAFYGCSSLTTIHIPSNVSSIGENAFEGCNATITVDSGNLYYAADNNFFYAKGGKLLLCLSEISGNIEIPSGVTSIGSSVFYGNNNITSITIPNGVISIGDFTFTDCSSLSSITIPNGITYIGMNVFQNCSSLTNIHIPDSVTYIDQSAFLNCSNLNSITIPNGLKSIRAYAFSGCSKLTNITIPNSVTAIGSCAFMSCDSLTDIYYNGSQSDWEKIRVDGGYPHYTPIGTITRDKIGIGNNVTIHYNSTSDNTTPDTPQPPAPTITALTSSNVQLSKTSVTYNGKPQKPSVTVKDANGNLVDAANYTISYSNNKNVGQATVTVTFSGNYSGTAKKNFNIVPKGTFLSKVTAQKKGFTAKWKKQAKQTTGYEIQYSTSSKFKGAKTIKNIKAKTTTKRISRLKAKKKYYVRIRTYKTIKGKKYYSDWSKSKTVVTKQ